MMVRLITQAGSLSGVDPTKAALNPEDERSVFRRFNWGNISIIREKRFERLSWALFHRGVVKE